MENKFDIGQFVPVLTLEQARCDLVNRFHSRRKELHYSQRKLSAISGVSYGSIRRFENTGEIALSSLLRLADVMGYLEDFESVFSRSHIVSLKDIK
jgi:transcriptional regulator with XRE-family HTH domain